MNPKRESWGDKPYRKDMDWNKCQQSKYKNDQYGTSQEIANAVHHYIDWLRACEKRKWDTRSAPNALHMLLSCQKGMPVNHSTKLHYDEDPERR